MTANSMVTLEGEPWHVSEARLDKRGGNVDNRAGVLILFTSSSGRRLSASANRPLEKLSESEIVEMLARCITWEQDA